MRLTAILIGAVSTVQAGQWDKCEEIRKCNCVPGVHCPETPFDGDCWMSTGSERSSNGEPSGKWTGNILYHKIKDHPRYNTNSAIWLVIDHFEGSYIDNECVGNDGGNNCWRVIGKGHNLKKIMRGIDHRSTQLNNADIRWNAEFDDGAPGSMIADRFIICDADVHSFDVDEPKPTPPPPSGQWDKCEEIELCNTSTMDLMFQPAGWTSTDMLYNRVACFYQQTNYQSPDGFIGIRQSEFEKVERFSTNSAVWIVVDDNFQVDAIADQCENNQEEGCWRAIGKGERLFKVMRGWNDGNTTLDTARIPVNTASATRMIICDADLHSFDVDEPEPEKLNPTLPNRFCNNAMMWYNPAGEPRQRWTLTKEKFAGLPNYVDTEKIYADGNGNYLWWTWVAWRGRWYISK